MCHYCGAHGSAAIYAGKGRKLGDPLVKFPTATGSNPVVRPLKSRTATQSKGHSHRSKLNGVVTSATFRRKYWWKLAWLSPHLDAYIRKGERLGKEGLSLLQLFENGELVNTKFRDSQKHFKLLQGARTIPYNIDAIRDTPECILVEGEFDALSYMAVGRTDVISVPNGANSQLDWLDELSESHFEQKQVIYLSVDTDRKGRELCRELSPDGWG